MKMDDMTDSLSRIREGKFVVSDGRVFDLKSCTIEFD